MCIHFLLFNIVKDEEPMLLYFAISTILASKPRLIVYILYCDLNFKQVRFAKSNDILCLLSV